MDFKPVEFCFGRVEYVIQKVTYDYSEDYDFYLSAEVKLPDAIFPPVLTVHILYNEVQKKVYLHNEGMADYVMMTMDSYGSKYDGFHVLTFEALEKEGFDLDQYMRYALMDMELRVTKQPNVSLN